MMKFIRILGISLLAIILLFLIIALILPGKYSVSSSVIINKELSEVYSYSSDLNNWPNWSIWKQEDKDAKITFDGCGTTVGSKMYWDGKKMGKGSMTIIEMKDCKSYSLKVDITEPWQSSSTSTFNFKQLKSGTEVTWTDEGNLSYPMERWVGVFMKSKMKESFKKGLDNLKKQVENDISIKNIKCEILDLEKTNFYAIPDSSSTMNDLSSKFASAYGELGKFINQNKIEMTGPPVAITTFFQPPNYKFLAAFQVKNNNIKGTGRITSYNMPKMKVARVLHIGAYESVNKTYNAIMTFIEKNNLEICGNSWEAYLNSPSDVKAEKLMTYIYFPVKEKNIK